MHMTCLVCQDGGSNRTKPNKAMDMQLVLLGKGQKGRQSVKKQREVRTRDKAFQRSMKAITNGDVGLSENGQEFVKTYQSSSIKVKAQLRDMWHLAGQDYDQCGLAVKAQRKAFAEKCTTATFLSEEQLHDEFKSAKHTESYIKFCDAHQLVKWDPKRECKVYYYEKKLMHWGSRDEGSLEKAHLCLVDDMAQSDEEDENSSSTDSESSSPKKKKKKSKKSDDSDSDAAAAKKKKEKKDKKAKKDKKDKKEKSEDEDAKPSTPPKKQVLKKGKAGKGKGKGSKGIGMYQQKKAKDLITPQKDASDSSSSSSSSD